jgi:phosphoglycerate dehydrogenase-like enzyme
MIQKTKPVAYITEPEEISLDQLVRLEEHYSLIAGNTNVNWARSQDIVGLVIRSRTIIDAELLSRLPSLQWVMRIGSGLELIDQTLLQRLGIKLFNSVGANATAVAEYVVGMMVLASRGWFKLTRESLTSWERMKFMGRELSHKTIGIIGFGEIGKAVYKRLLLWGCKDFLVFDPYLDEEARFRWGLTFVDSLPDLLKQSDFVTIHVPLTRDTYYLLDAGRLNELKQGVILLNTARGAVVDEEALLSIMPRKKGIYVADVFEHEPTIRGELLDAPWVIATPHIAAMTEEAQSAMIRKAIDHLLAFEPVKKGVYETNQPRV